MATVNLAQKFADRLDERFTKGSITDSAVGSDYDWAGVNAIKVYTIDAPTLNDYNASASSNRFGTPTEVDDELNTYSLAQKKSFTKTFDMTNVQDQMFKKRSAAYLKQTWDERYVPAIDTYRLGIWANGAGLGAVNGTVLTKATFAEKYLLAHAALDDADVPQEGRIAFVRNDICVAAKLAQELQYNQNYTQKSILNGQIADIVCPVIATPTSRMPSGVEFMIKYKRASADPVKLRLLRANDNAPGIAGTLMEGLVRYDSFVMAQKADGIYVYAQYMDAPVTAIAENSSDNKLLFTLSGTATGTLYYTIDGTNPKVSGTRSTLTVTAASSVATAAALANGTYNVRAYFDATASSNVCSYITSATVTLAHA